MGPVDGREKDLAREEIRFYGISAGKMRRYASFKNFSDTVKVIIGVLQAAWRLFFIMPDVIFSKGGFGAFPVLCIARLYRIPVVIHESDAVPGVVNHWSSAFARRIAVSFESAAKFFPPEKTAVTGSPIRTRILGGNIQDAKKEFSIMTDDPILFFVSGSQGSKKINEVLLDALSNLVKKYEVIHQTGLNNFEQVKGESSVILERLHKEKYHPVGFLHEGALRQAFFLADLIVSRASSTIFEIAAVEKPSILVPLEGSAQDHQRVNAYEYAKAGACRVIEEQNLTPHLLLAEIEQLFENPDRMSEMRKAAQRFSAVNASEVVAREIIKIGLH